MIVSFQYDTYQSEMRVFKPCENNEDSGYMTYGYFQAGMSVALKNDTIILGKFLVM